MQIGVRMLADQSGHEAGQQLLGQMYLEYTGKALPPVYRTPRGKPYIPGDPVHFSISHTKRRVFCVLSDTPVGIDAEEADRQIDLRLADKILSPAEKLRYHRAADKRMTLLRFWVLKEALAKASGEGLRGYPNATDLDPEDPRIILRDGCLVAVVRGTGEENYVV